MVKPVFFVHWLSQLGKATQSNNYKNKYDAKKKNLLE